VVFAYFADFGDSVVFGVGIIRILVLVNALLFGFIAYVFDVGCLLLTVFGLVAFVGLLIVGFRFVLISLSCLRFWLIIIALLYL